MLSPPSGGIDFTPDGTRFFVTDTCGGPQRLGQVNIVDVATGAVVDQIRTGGMPVGLDLAPDGSRASRSGRVAGSP